MKILLIAITCVLMAATFASADTLIYEPFTQDEFMLFMEQENSGMKILEGTWIKKTVRRIVSTEGGAGVIFTDDVYIITVTSRYYNMLTTIASQCKANNILMGLYVDGDKVKSVGIVE